MYEMVASLLCEIRSDYGTFSVLRRSLGQECGDLGQSKALAELGLMSGAAVLGLGMIWTFLGEDVNSVQ